MKRFEAVFISMVAEETAEHLEDEAVFYKESPREAQMYGKGARMLHAAVNTLSAYKMRLALYKCREIIGAPLHKWWAGMYKEGSFGVHRSVEALIRYYKIY